MKTVGGFLFFLIPNIGYLISYLGYGTLVICNDSACCLVNKILPSELNAFLN